MNHYVMDYETLSNCFVGVFEHYKKEEVKVFVIHALQNDLEEFISFLENNVENREWHISYNGLAFDAQITQHILNNKDFLLTQTSEEVAAWIYQMAQDCINRSKSKQWQVYPQWHLTIGQIDIFKMHHWDNPAKRSSLKWIQYSMDWENIIDMPIEHTSNISSKEEIDLIIRYAKNILRPLKKRS